MVAVLPGLPRWITASPAEQKRFLVTLQNMLEVAERERRMLAMQAILYLVQGEQIHCLSVCLSVCLSPSLSLSVSLSVSLSLSLSVSLSSPWKIKFLSLSSLSLSLSLSLSPSLSDSPPSHLPPSLYESVSVPLSPLSLNPLFVFSVFQPFCHPFSVCDSLCLSLSLHLLPPLHPPPITHFSPLIL